MGQFGVSQRHGAIEGLSKPMRYSKVWWAIALLACFSLPLYLQFRLSFIQSDFHPNITACFSATALHLVTADVNLVSNVDVDGASDGRVINIGLKGEAVYCQAERVLMKKSQPEKTEKSETRWIDGRYEHYYRPESYKHEEYENLAAKVRRQWRRDEYFETRDYSVKEAE